MATKTSVAENLDRLALQYQAVIDAAAMLKEIGSLETARDECKQATATARAELDAAKEELVKAKADAKKAKDQAKQILDGAVIDANDQALQLQRAAEEQHAEIVKRAQDMSAAMLEQAATQRASISAELERLNAAAQQVRDEITNLQNAKAEIVAQYDDADKKLQALKGKLKALMD